MATILIVDDRPTNREFLVTLLGYSGHRLLEAADGAEALVAAEAVHFDLIIADILMPTMDGYEFVRRLRANPDIAGVPVIFYTAHYHEKEARALAKACGVTHILYKPCEPEVVLRTVEAALGTAPPPTLPPAADEFDREHLRIMTDKLSQKAEELRKTNERLTALVELGLQLGSERDPQRLLSRFCHTAREIIGARYATVGIVTRDGQLMRHFFTSGLDAATTQRLGTAGQRPNSLSTVLAECRSFRQGNPGGEPAALGFPSSYPPIHSWLGAPLVSPAHVYGWLCLFDKIGADTFSDEDERLAGILAAQVGRIYENGSLYADLLRQTAELQREMAERQRGEESLRASEERIRLLLDSTVEAICGVDLDGNCTFSNQACARLLGYTEPSQILGKNLHNLAHHSHPDGTPYPHAECHNHLAVRRGEAIHIDNEVLWRADGTSFPVEYWSHPMRRQGRIVGAVLSFMDITERKKLEGQFRQVQQRIQHVVASSPAVLYTLVGSGADFRPTWISENVQKMLGYSVEEIFQPGWWHERVHPEDLPRVRAEIQNELLAHGRLAHEYRFRHQDGKYRWLRSEMLLLRDAAGKPEEVVGSWSDITEYKLLEDQYRQAQKMEAIGRLAGGVAHDFNNLLTVIIGYSEVLLGGLREQDPLRDSLEEIRKAGQRAASLTRQLLAFSRKHVLLPEIIDLNTLLADMGKMFSRLIGEDIELRFTSAPDLGKVKVDPGLMEQVIMNLVVNARDAMPHGGKLTIETANVMLDETYAGVHANTRTGSYILVAVSDTGCGMDEATKAQIFLPFFTTKGPEKGTGLGLATVYGIVQMSGGRIEVYSEVGVGTTFKVYLPRAGDEAAPSKVPASRPGRPRGAETLLLVEDEDGVRLLARLILEKQGYKILEARNGGEALLLCQQYEGTIHLVVTDVVMPHMSGRVLIEQLAPLRPGLKVLYLSGYTDDAIVHHGVLDPNTPFLQKPFTADALAWKVRETLDG